MTTNQPQTYTTTTENAESKDEPDNEGRTEEEEPRPEAVEAEREEMAVPQEMSTNREEAIHLEEIIPGKGKIFEMKAVKASVKWTTLHTTPSPAPGTSEDDQRKDMESMWSCK